jgi:hypothetical protein
VSAIRRIGLTRDPPGGWPLDQLFVGVATLRTTRELFRQSDDVRAWDLALRTGVTPQGTTDSLRRLERLGLVRVFPAWADGHAPSFRLDQSHYLVALLGRLFHAERVAARRASRRGGQG